MSFDAHVYCLTHQGIPGDVDYYRRACRGTSKVLELGMGEGRIAVPIVEDGASLWGIENHPGMLSRARGKRALLPPDDRERFTIIDASMTTFSLPQTFDRIIVPFTGMFCPSPEERRRCLELVKAHLAPDGLFIFDVYPTDLVSQMPDFEEEEFWLMSIADGAQCIEVFQRDVYRPSERVIEVTYRNVTSTEGHETCESQYTLQHHYVATDEWDNELAQAGLELVSIQGGFDGSAFDDESERIILVVR